MYVAYLLFNLCFKIEVETNSLLHFFLLNCNNIILYDLIKIIMKMTINYNIILYIVHFVLHFLLFTLFYNWKIMKKFIFTNKYMVTFLLNCIIKIISPVSVKNKNYYNNTVLLFNNLLTVVVCYESEINIIKL